MDRKSNASWRGLAVAALMAVVPSVAAASVACKGTVFGGVPRPFADTKHSNDGFTGKFPDDAMPAKHALVASTWGWGCTKTTSIDLERARLYQAVACQVKSADFKATWPFVPGDARMVHLLPAPDLPVDFAMIRRTLSPAQVEELTCLANAVWPLDPEGRPVRRDASGALAHDDKPPQPVAPHSVAYVKLKDGDTEKTIGGYTRVPADGPARDLFDAVYKLGNDAMLPAGQARADALPAPRAWPADALPVPPPRDLPDNGLARTPPMGWNSWNHFAGRITDADVRAMADAMVATGMRDAGYVYVNIDDTWEGKRDASGNIQSNEKFPDMKALADYVHGKGLKLGIYSSPGPTTCAKFEGSYGHELQDAKTYAAWGIDFLKYDYCGANDVYPLTLASQQGTFQKMGEALAKVDRPIVYSLSQGGEFNPWTWGKATGANLWRTTQDIQDNWTSMERIGFAQLAIVESSKPGHWNDPDMLEVGNGGMSADEYRTHMSLWAMLSAPLLAGNDLRGMTDETKSILLNREVIAIDQEANPGHPYRVDAIGDLDVIARPMNDGSMVISFFNRGDGEINTTFDLATVHGMDKSGSSEIRDLWAHQAVAAKAGSVTVHVPRHGVYLLRVASRSAAQRPHSG